MRVSLSAAVLSVLSAFVGVEAASAKVVYNVSDTSVVNCSGAPHGLWTNNFYSGSCANYFSIDNGTQFIFDNDDADSNNWTGTLTGTATNPFNETATISITFNDFREVYTYKKEGGVNYNPATDTPDIDFFAGIAGTIEIGGETFSVNVGNPSPMGLGFQWGVGANAKTTFELGGSSWLNMLRATGGSAGGHWDLNLKFEVVNVPEPGLAGLVLLGSGLLLYRRRRQTIRA